MQNPSDAANPVPKRLAMLLLAIGLLFALDSFFELAFVYKLWPLLVAAVGSGLIAIYVKGNRRMPLFLAGGVYLVCFSGLALYCNFSSWSALAALWPLFVAFLGAALVCLAFFQRTRYVYVLAGLLLISLAVVFYLTLSISGRWWWTSFVLAGLSILVAEKCK